MPLLFHTCPRCGNTDDPQISVVASTVGAFCPHCFLHLGYVTLPDLETIKQAIYELCGADLQFIAQVKEAVEFKPSAYPMYNKAQYYTLYRHIKDLINKNPLNANNDTYGQNT